MRYNLSSGKKVEVRFNHIYQEVMVKPKLGKRNAWTTEAKPFSTECSININDIDVFEDSVTCHPSDQFNKMKGRLKAFNRVLDDIRLETTPLLSKQERKELFNAVFPKLASQPRIRNKNKQRVTELQTAIKQDVEGLKRITNTQGVTDESLRQTLSKQFEGLKKKFGWSK